MNKTGFYIVALLTLSILGIVFMLSRPGFLRTSTVGINTDCELPTYTLSSKDSTHPGMVWVPGGEFFMGSEVSYFEEGPQHAQQLTGFWMDKYEVTNAQFTEFVTATGYQTLAQQGLTDPDLSVKQGRSGSAVFIGLLEKDNLDPRLGWWRFEEGANWLHPEGITSHIEDRQQFPVVHIAYEDALAYADWLGHSLPSEAQFEFAALSSARKDSNGDHQSNTWQGFFPFQNNPDDGFVGTAPVGCYSPNQYGLHDLIGNVWEWTSSPYYASHNFASKDNYPEGFDPNQPGEAVAVIKGGSYLCAPNFCMRYRPEARQAQSKGLGTSHIGFRTVINPPS